MVRATSFIAASLAVVAIVPPATGELLSSRPITIVIPFTPGASADTFQRIVAKKVTDATGQIFVVESRPGGAGSIGAMAVKQAAPDGMTLFQANSGTHGVNVSLYPNLAYDAIKDFRPITLEWSFPQLLAVPVSSPAHTVAELVALAKTRPNGLSFASQGSGSGGHIAGEVLRSRTGANMVHVPYRGAGPAAVDLAAGRVDFFFVSYASVLPFLQSKRVRVLAVTSSKRIAVLPDAPTMEEAGFPDYESSAWFGLVAPAQTPQPIVDKLNAAFTTALRDPEVAKQFASHGAEGGADTPAEFGAFIASEIERNGKIVKSVGIKLE
jgi:tripartite-type tricarboxylate transporter receptor subunit TctC